MLTDLMGTAGVLRKSLYVENYVNSVWSEEEVLNFIQFEHSFLMICLR